MSAEFLEQMLGIRQEPPAPLTAEDQLSRLAQHQREYAEWLCGPCRFAPGDTVTALSGAPISAHGILFMVVDVDRQPDEKGSSQRSSPPSRSRKTGLREDVRLSFVDRDGLIKSLWVEGWMLEPWTAEQAQRHTTLASASTEGAAQ